MLKLFNDFGIYANFYNSILRWTFKRSTICGLQLVGRSERIRKRTRAQKLPDGQRGSAGQESCAFCFAKTESTVLLSLADFEPLSRIDHIYTCGRQGARSSIRPHVMPNTSS